MRKRNVSDKRRAFNSLRTFGLFAVVALEIIPLKLAVLKKTRKAYLVKVAKDTTKEVARMKMINNKTRKKTRCRFNLKSFFKDLIRFVNPFRAGLR